MQRALSSKPSTTCANPVSYLFFLLAWIVPPIGLLWGFRRPPTGGVGGARARWALVLTCLTALVWTTPWDNYLVWRGVWAYGHGRVVGVIGYVPVEEYAFFLLQPLLTGLLLYRILERVPPVPSPTGGAMRAAKWVVEDNTCVRYTGGAIAALISCFGFYLLEYPGDDGIYLGLILAWAMPVVAGLWFYAGHHFWAWRRALLAALVPSTLYLWIADRYAIAHGIWSISNRYSFDLDPLGLPVEEAVFFIVTNVLSLLGAMLFLHGDVIRPFWKRDG